MKRFRLWLCLSLLPHLVAGSLVAQFGGEVSPVVSFGGRLQTQLNTSSMDDVPGSEILLRRARIELNVQINERISGVIQPDFGGEDVELKDAYLNLSLSPGMDLLFGKAYRPFGLLEQTSSKRILPIERGLRIRGLRAADEYGFLSGLGYSNRDIGIQLRGSPPRAPLGLTYSAGLLRGPAQDLVVGESSFQLAGRVTVSPVENLRLGAGWSGRDFVDGATAGSAIRRGDAFEVDLEYGTFAQGFHLLAEASRGEIDPFRDTSFWGAQAWLAYRTSALPGSGLQLEPLLRLSVAGTEGIDPATERGGGTLVTPGINLYLTPINRLMLNYDVWNGEDASPDAGSLKVMFQLGF